MKAKSWEEIRNKISVVQFRQSFDFIVAIGRGGIIPALLVAEKLRKDCIEIIWLRFRDDSHRPLYSSPTLLQPLTFQSKGKHILLVDDVLGSGSTLQYTRSLLKDAKSISTFVVNGKADYSLYNEECFSFPWFQVDKE